MIPKMPAHATSPAASEGGRPGGGFSAAWAAAAVAFFVALASASALVAHHTAGLVQLPGCSAEQSACEELAAGAFGRILGLPLSSIGAAYFSSVLIAWFAALLYGVHPALRWLLRLGAAGSLFYLGVMLFEGRICPWCLCVHLANLIGVASAEAVRRDQADLGRNWLAAAGAFGLLLLAGLGTWERMTAGEIAQAAEENLNETIDEVVAASLANNQRESGDSSTATDASAPPEETAEESLENPFDVAPTPTDGDLFPADGSDENSGDEAAAESTTEGPSPVYHPLSPPRGFTGRWRTGPAEAVMRIVVWGDYECPACQKFDRTAMEFVERNRDVSLSIRHLPICRECNPLSPLDKHKHACRAALAVEAAGMVGGEESFWQMHDWVLRRKAVFTDDEVRSAVAALKIADPDEFWQAMHSEDAMQRVLSDVEAARVVGMGSTPLVFVNGLELENWNVDNALEQVVVKLRDAGVEPASAVVDRPRSGVERYFRKYFDASSPAIGLTRTNERWALGPADAPIQMVLFTGRLGPHAPIFLDAVLKVLETSEDVRLVPRHYPLDVRFNTLLQGDAEDFFPGDAEATLAVEAAGRIAGLQGFWKMHEWIARRAKTFRPDDLHAAAAELGIDPQQLAEEMKSTEAARAIAGDLRLAASKGMRFGPKLIVNDHLLDGVAANPEVVAAVVEALREKIETGETP